MKTLGQIKIALEAIEFSSVAQWLCDFLKAFEIPDSTIKKIISKISIGRNLSSASLYKRAIFIYCPAEEELPIIAQYRDTYKIVFILKDSSFSFATSERDFLNIPYSRIVDYAVYLVDLQNKGRIEKDTFAALDFAPIVGELNTRLCLVNEDKFEVFNFILNLITISFIDQAINRNLISRYISWLKSADLSDVNTYIKSIVKEGEYQDFLAPLNEGIIHTKATKELVRQLLEYRIKTIDSEVLGSLVYKIFASADDSSLFGNQTAKTYINRLLEPLFVFPFKASLEAGDYDKALKLFDSKFFDPTNSPGSFLVDSFTKVVELSFTFSEKTGLPAPLVSYENFIALVSNDVSLRLTKINFFIAYVQYISSLHTVDIEECWSVFRGLRINIGNQLRTSWKSICPNTGNVFVIGSPRFKGNRKLDVRSKCDMTSVFGDIKLGDADYSSAWLLKGSRYIAGTDSKLGMVFTNSVCQGSQVATIWFPIYNSGCHIDFAYAPFKWENPDCNGIAVSVVMIGLSGKRTNDIKLLFHKSTCYRCRSISPYLIPNSELIVNKTSKAISPRPKMVKGNMPYAKAILFSEEEKNRQVSLDPELKQYVRKVYGSDELMDGRPRFCIFVKDSEEDAVISKHPFAKRLYDLSRQERSEKRACPEKLILHPLSFREMNHTTNGSQTLVVPSVSSENRQYHPMAFVYSDAIITNLAFAIYDCDVWILALLESNMHHIWQRLVCGQLESRDRYSNELAYNTFPFPQLDEGIIAKLKNLSLELIRIREEFCEVPLGKLYSNLPPKLKNIHSQIDEYVDSLYTDKPFFTDFDRLTKLMELYSATLNS